MAAISGPNIPLDGLVFNMDPASALSYPARNDPFRDQVSLLLDGTSFTDKSRNNFTVTTYGNAQIVSDGTFGNVMSFDGNGDYLSVSSNAAFNFGTSDFTIEAWVYVNSSSGVQVIYDLRPITSGGLYPTVYYYNGSFRYYQSQADRIISSSISLSTWYHVAIVRSSSTTKMYLNGVQTGSSYSDSNNYSYGSGRPWIGADSYNGGLAPANYFNGRIGPLRIVKGVALYTANFTPPSTPLSLPSRIKDIKNDIIGTLTNGPVYNNVQKGSISFDGSDDYIIFSRPSQLVTGGQISISMWARWVSVGTSIGTIQMLLDNNHTGSQGFVIQDRPDLGKVLTFNSVATTNIIGDGLWHHIVGTNDGTTSRIYIDGILNNSSAEANGLKTVQPSISLGKWQGGTRYLNGSLGKILIYNRALSASEIKDIYTSEREKYVEIPKTISGLQLWLDGADLSTLRQNSNGTTAVVLNSDPIGYWADKSGNGRNVLQATSSYRPTLSISPMNMVKFDGISQFIELASTLSLSDMTIFWIGILDETPSNGTAMFHGASTSHALNMYTAGYYWYQAPDILQGASSSWVISQLTLSQVSRLSGVWDIKHNNISKAVTLNSSTSAIIKGIGKSYSDYSNMRVGEVIIYNSYLSEYDRNIVRSYLNKKWGVF